MLTEMVTLMEMSIEQDKDRVRDMVEEAMEVHNTKMEVSILLEKEVIRIET